MTLGGVGVDVASIPRMQRILDEHGDSFTTRWFTPDERARCAGDGSPARAFAMTLAAKEAVWKALDVHPWSGAVPWRWIDIAPVGASPAVTVRLLGPLAATEAGGAQIRVSLASAGSVVTATAMTTHVTPAR